MAQYTIRVMHNGQPLEGAEVTVGDKFNAVTDANGEVGKSVSGLNQPLAMEIIVEAPGIESGGGPYKLLPNQVLILEV